MSENPIRIIEKGYTNNEEHAHRLGPEKRARQIHTLGQKN